MGVRAPLLPAGLGVPRISSRTPALCFTPVPHTPILTLGQARGTHVDTPRALPSAPSHLGPRPTACPVSEPELGDAHPRELKCLPLLYVSSRRQPEPAQRAQLGAARLGGGGGAEAGRRGEAGSSPRLRFPPRAAEAAGPKRGCTGGLFASPPSTLRLRPPNHSVPDEHNAKPAEKWGSCLMPVPLATGPPLALTASGQDHK